MKENNIKTGIQIIAAERQRQVIEEGWTSEHDDEHTDGELAIAAACYACPNYDQDWAIQSQLQWPWDRKWWKPTADDRIRELAKAGALIAAEIDRLQRIPSEAGEKIESQRRCKLPDDELLKRCGDWIRKLCESGGEAWCLRVPVDFDNDPDMLFIELLTRYKESKASR